MTNVLKPSEIARRDFMPADRAGPFIADVEHALDDLVDGFLPMGNRYDVGGDVDLVLYFDHRTTREGIAAHRAIREQCARYRLRHCDIVAIAERDDRLDGIDDVRGVGPILHILGKMDERRILSGRFRRAIERTLASRGGRSMEALRNDIVSYASHKSLSLMEHAAPVFDPENEECVKGLGKVLSFAPHMLAKLWRACEPFEPPSKDALERWVVRLADESGGPWLRRAANLMERQRTYRSLLRSTIEGNARPSAYVEFLEEVWADDAPSAVELARAVDDIL